MAVEVNALLSLVEETELCALVGVDDGQDASNALADIMDAGELGGATGDLAGPELDELARIRQHLVFPAALFSSGDARLEVGELGAQVLLGLLPQGSGLLQRL